MLELEATDIAYGPVPPQLGATPPAGAEVTGLEPGGTGVDPQDKPTHVEGVAAVPPQLAFQLSAPAKLVGLPRHEVRLVTLGEDGEKGARGHRHRRPAPRRDRRAPAAREGRDARRLPGARRAGARATAPSCKLPKVSIDGTEGTELATALGTVVPLRARWRRLHGDRLGPAGRGRGRREGPAVGGSARGPRAASSATGLSPRSPTST